MLHKFICPNCLLVFFGHVEDTLHTNLCHYFPETYGRGYLICDTCVPKALDKIAHL